MKIVYGSNSRIPTERAHGIQAIEMCNAFADAGHDVELMVPNKKNAFAQEDPYSFYNIPNIFKITYLPSFNLFSDSKLGFYIQNLVNSMLFALYALRRSVDIYYIKDEKVAYILSFFVANIVWEPHVGNVNFIARRIGKRSFAIIALTDGVKQDLVKNGIKESKIMVAHDAVRLSMFDVKEVQSQARQELNLPRERKMVMYVGHLFAWKGVNVLTQAMQKVNPNTVCVFVGGLADDVERMKLQNRGQKNIVFIGNQPREFIPKYLAAADILVLPNSGKYTISQLYTSPLKLFEYMASKRPVIASRLPSLMEVLNDQNAYLVEPDNSDVLASTINGLISTSVEAVAKVDSAYKTVCNNTWEVRASKICKFIFERTCKKV